LRIVLDTNILVSAIIHDGKPRNLLKMGIDDKYKIIISKETLNELAEVLQRPKFKMKGEDVIHIISVLMQTGDLVQVSSNFETIGDDPDDNIIINTAHDGKADYVVTEDKDIKIIKKFHKIKC
jgi:putative PIN family toxin of toxin-antitoxin system